mgnify:CR=1 FL=1
MRLTTEHILLLISATGEFIYLYFGILAATAAFNREKLELIMGHAHNTTQEITNQKIFVAENALIFVMNSIDIAQIAIQTFALVIATSNLPFNWNDVNDPQRVKHYITEVLYYLCVCNGAKWVTDSFIEGHYLRSKRSKDPCIWRHNLDWNHPDYVPSCAILPIPFSPYDTEGHR